MLKQHNWNVWGKRVSTIPQPPLGGSGIKLENSHNAQFVVHAKHSRAESYHTHYYWHQMISPSQKTHGAGNNYSTTEFQPVQVILFFCEKTQLSCHLGTFVILIILPVTRFSAASVTCTIKHLKSAFGHTKRTPFFRVFYSCYSPMVGRAENTA